MKNLIKVLPLIAVLSLTSCKKDQKADQLIVEEQQAVEAPVVQTQDELVKEAQSKPLTTLALSEANFDFGKLKKGDHVEHIYEVTNTGTNPLIISQVKPGCGCTVPDYTKDPILPGQKGKITLKFDSTNFDGLVNKQAEVYANVEKAPIVLTFSADIQPN
ncbi:MAG TPA: DUF1573 domain-containing protein [Kaistella sp.]|uniref:DUF1573 domain-containing protein n=1 Tax=Candidatus Kaistella beijingensis TaxID=2820270 RepID=UPI000EBB5A12|nr:DUF1573 domain-containing protein [Candidatus Kaistella beijingensis]MBE2273378.1 DUF1573 domain-containing protein [Flavobacteriales bacterium]MCA0390905.1 DUF1573 domain-containing protein [Bacteroidota bacterium]HCN10778.1 hypothetical protein [Chryseobacterium sp.]HMU06518.1 DUF1573 domain-containing protein [Kaistella sp.]MBN8621728.1 DUF1573 domain-containing protein [Flavobacteriales bacterium]